MANTMVNYFTQWTEVATQNTNVAATATHAGVAGQRHFITGYSVSSSAAPAAAVSVTIKTASTTLEQVELPAAAFAPIVVNFSSPIRGGINEAITITCPAVGGTTRSTVTVRGFTMYE
jgi:hypothetical protein